MISKAMTMSEGALTKDFDLIPGKWRINASLPGHKVVSCALEGPRHRPFPLRQVEASEFAQQVYPPPLHTWRLILTYEPREETCTRNALRELTGASKSDL
jgi:hypothetical protein